LTAEVWQTRDKRAEADLSGKCQDVEVLSIQHFRRKCGYTGFVSRFLSVMVLSKMWTSCRDLNILIANALLWTLVHTVQLVGGYAALWLLIMQFTCLLCVQIIYAIPTFLFFWDSFTAFYMASVC